MVDNKVKEKVYIENGDSEYLHTLCEYETKSPRTIERDELPTINHRAV